MPMTDTTPLRVRANLKQLKLPTMLAEWQKLAREAADRDEPYEGYLLRLTELEVAARSANAVAARIRAAGFPVQKDFDTFDFTATPGLPKQKVLELARGEWVEQRFNCCLIGGSGTGKTHVATALGLALCRLGKRVGFVTAAGLVTLLEEAQQQHRLDRLLTQLDRLDLLIVDELGYLSFNRSVVRACGVRTAGRRSQKMTHSHPAVAHRKRRAVTRRTTRRPCQGRSAAVRV